MHQTPWHFSLQRGKPRPFGGRCTAFVDTTAAGAYVQILADSSKALHCHAHLIEAAPVTGEFQMFRSDSTANGNVVRRFSPDGGGPSTPPAYAQPRRLTYIERTAKRTI